MAFSNWISVKQPRLGSGGLLALMVLATVFGALSSDMSTPALPELPNYFHTTEAVVGQTITFFFVANALGFLLSGPVSDKLGRRPVLIGGSLLYAAGSVLCAAAPTIGTLIAARVVQGFGAGTIDTMCTALAKDCFYEDKREQALSLIQTLFVVVPIVGPLLGGFVLTVLPWHAIFLIQGAVAILCLILSLLFEESLPENERSQVPVSRSLGRLVVVAKNPGFTFALLILSAVNLPFMAYIGSAPYIYVEEFGLTQQQYTYFFAASALFAAFGPSLSVMLLERMPGKKYASLMMAGAILCGAAMLAVGSLAPLAFWVCFMVYAVLEAAIRPFAANLLLEQQEGDAGSVSSLYNFVCTVLGSVGTAVIMLPWPTYIIGLGLLIVGIMGVALVAWVLGLRAGVKVEGI